MDDLKPCPFCGSHDVKIFAFNDGGICVKCLDCYCRTRAESDWTIAEAKRGSAYEKIVSAWNRRASDETD